MDGIVKTNLSGIYVPSYILNTKIGYHAHNPRGNVKALVQSSLKY